MKEKPRIGIPTNLRDKRFGTNEYYIEWVSQFGTPVLLTPYVPQYGQFDVLFLPGGKDVLTAERTFLKGPADPYLEWFDNMYINKCLLDKKPIIAICRGMQALNVHLEGSLRNLNPKECEIHNKASSEEEKNSLVHRLYKINRIAFDSKHVHYNVIGEVNSIHHQAIDKLASTLEATTFSYCRKNSGDMLIESFRGKGFPAVGFQWHPEKIWDNFSKEEVKLMLNKYYYVK